MQLHKYGRAVLLCIGIAASAYAALIVSRYTTSGLIGTLGLQPDEAVKATMGAEAVARIMACCVVLWKMSYVLAEEKGAREMLALAKTRAMLLCLALFATMFLAMDQRTFWFMQYMTGDISEFSRAEQMVYQFSFNALGVNCISVLLFNVKNWREGLLAMAWLTMLSLGGFLGVLAVMGHF